MRLICPNCDAQYEIDASLIPDTGRDVQCSNCGTTWFQPPEGGLPETLVAEEPVAPVAEPEPAPQEPEAPAPAAQGAEPAVEEEYEAEPDLSGVTDEAAAFFGAAAPATAEPAPEAEFETPPPAEPAPEAELEVPPPPADPEPVVVDAPEPTPEFEPEADPDLPRRELDPEVRTILREEAEREVAARRLERGEVIETQPDLGLDGPSEGASAAAARLRGDPLETSEPPDESLRKSLLPDVDEINSTLTATSDRPDRLTTTQEIEETIKRRSGFRLGFAVLLGLATLLIVLYLNAPAIGRAVPGLETAMAGYVDWANGMRLAIDGLLERTLGGLIPDNDAS